jgi:DNA-binding transcriptional regulator GbsR (MarR family)
MSAVAGARARFILQWSEAATRFGMNRTAAKVHALLFLAARPMTAAEVAESLAISPSSVSNSLRELQDAGLVRGVQSLGDRRDRFEAVKDPWEMGRLILEDRKRRAFDPAFEILHETLKETMASGEVPDSDCARLRTLLKVLEAVEERLLLLPGRDPAASRSAGSGPGRRSVPARGASGG